MPSEITEKYVDTVCDWLGPVLGSICKEVNKVRNIANPEYGATIQLIHDLRGQLFDLQSNARQKINNELAGLAQEGVQLTARYADLTLKLQQKFFETQIDLAKVAVENARAVLAKAREGVTLARRLHQRAQGHLAVWRKQPKGN